MRRHCSWTVHLSRPGCQSQQHTLKQQNRHKTNVSQTAATTVTWLRVDLPLVSRAR
jgi:hypothetical protein